MINVCIVAYISQYRYERKLGCRHARTNGRGKIYTRNGWLTVRAGRSFLSASVVCS